MEKVLTGAGLCLCIKATIREESTPPDKNAPRGTSATIRNFTASLSKASLRPEDHQAKRRNDGLGPPSPLRATTSNGGTASCHRFDAGPAPSRVADSVTP